MWQDGAGLTKNHRPAAREWETVLALCSEVTLHLPKLAALGTLGFVRQVERQARDSDSQHASGRKISLPVRACWQSPVQSQNLNLNSQL